MFTMTRSWRWWAVRVVLLAVFLAVVGSQTLAPEPEQTDSTQQAPSPPSAPADPGGAELGQDVTPEVPLEPDGKWRAAAAAYGEAFVDTSGGIEAWRARINELVSPSMAQGYSYTDLASIPVADLVETSTEEIPVSGETPSRRVRLFYTGDLVVDVTVAWDPAIDGEGFAVEGRGWVITTAVPVEDPELNPLPTPPPAPDEADVAA